MKVEFIRDAIYEQGGVAKVFGLPMFVPFISAGVETFDAMKALAVTRLIEADEFFRDLLAKNPHRSFEVYVAGWSETTGADLYVITNHLHHEGVQPFEVTQLFEFSTSPMSYEVQQEMFKMLPANPTAADVRPEIEGVALMELQRAATFPAFEGEPQSITKVGGFCHLTTIKPDYSITMRILKRWNDCFAREPPKEETET